MSDYMIQVVVNAGDLAALPAFFRGLRMYHPKTHVQIITDGCDLPDSMRCLIDDNVNYIKGEAIMLFKEHGAEWIHRRFELFLREGVGQVCIKTDPDVKFWRPFIYVPDADLFGTSNPLHRQPHFPVQERGIQGGCYGLSRRIAECVVKAGYFNRVEWRDPPIWAYSYARILEDVNTYYILSRFLGVKVFTWDEILSRFREYPANPLVNGIPRYAITHPHKDYLQPFVIGNPHTGILVEDAKDAQWRIKHA